MAKFKVIYGGSKAREIEADHFIEKGSLIVFIGDDKNQVFALPTSLVATIERLDNT